QEDLYRITIIAVLLAGACFSTYYFHAIVQTSTVFTHFFYIPIILASLWWKRKGLVVALFLAALLILSHIFLRSETEIANDLIRALFFIVISLGVATLSEQITKTEGLLRESRDYLEKLINCANTPIILWDTAFKIKRVNHGFERLTGYSTNELIDQEIYMLFPVTIRDELLGKIERTISGSDLNSVEIPILCKNGDIRTSLWNSANILTKDGATHLVTIAQGIDITERMQADEELRKTKEYLDNIIESSLDCILVTDREGHITIANKAFLNLLGHTSEEIIGKHTVELSPTEEGTYKSTTGESVEIGKEFFDSTKAIIQGKFFKEDKLSNWETYLIRKDRIVIPVEENLVYLNDDQGNRIGAVGIIRDITERKQIEKTLQESEERLRTLVSNIPGAVYRCDCDPDWTMRFLSEAILEISGYPASDFINNEVQTYASIIHPDDRSFVEKVVFEATEQKRPYIIEYRIVNANGSVRWVYEKGQGVFGKNNEVLWLDGAIFDNTDRKKTEEDKTKIEGRLENKVTELSIMNEISEVLLSTRELDEILHMILIGATAYQALGFNRAFLFLINEEETMLEGKVATGSLTIDEAYKIWEGLARESHTLKELLKSRHGELSKEDEPINNLVKKMKIPLREGGNIFTQAVYENKSFNIKDGTDNPLIDKNFTSLLGTDTFALVPLVSRGKTLGVLLADNFINKNPIVDEDVERLGAFANHASLAIENSHLYKSSREKVEELSR
ncbi:MAG: PAS domain S-box protein, partial [Deltaproteobacteria bacterium]|nr:PAS domain S-box protein [Deltaproteobacteria bacterium]